jgi:hypothetical protein
MTEPQNTAHKRPRCCSLRCPIYRSPHSYRDGVDSLTEKAEQGELCAHILCCLTILTMTPKAHLDFSGVTLPRGQQEALGKESGKFHQWILGFFSSCTLRHT